MAHLTNQSNRPALLFLFFFIESFEAQDNQDKSGQIPIEGLPKIPTPRLHFKIALFFRKRNSVNLQNAATKPRETPLSTMDINAHCAFYRMAKWIFKGELQRITSILSRQSFQRAMYL